MTPLNERRERLRDARLLLIFTPEAAPDGTAFERLEAALEHVDIVQVRIKGVPRKGSGGAVAPATARATFDWALRVVDLVRTTESKPLVFVNDRVDVAAALMARGVDGVHLGDRDMPPASARALLGADALLGLSTHSMNDVVRASEEPVDLLGFGPIFPTSTKGYGIEGSDPSDGAKRPLGPEAAWVASQAATSPLFPIGGIDLANAAQLEPVGRCAVGSAILSSPAAPAAARALKRTVMGINDWTD